MKLLLRKAFINYIVSKIPCKKNILLHFTLENMFS